MPYTIPTLDDVAPAPVAVVAEMQHFKPAIDGDFTAYMVGAIMELAQVKLADRMAEAIQAELATYTATYGTAEESDDVADYWAGFDEELVVFFDPLIDLIGVVPYGELFGGKPELADYTTREMLCQQVAVLVAKAQSWRTLAHSGFMAQHGYDKIGGREMPNGTFVVFLAPPIIAPKAGRTAHLEHKPVPSATPDTPPAPDLSAIRGQPNTQLLHEAFRLMRDAFKASDTVLADVANVSRTTFYHYATGKIAPKITPAQANAVKNELDRRIEQLQRVANIFAQVTK